MTAKTYANMIRHAEIHNARLARKASAQKAPASDEALDFEFAVSTPKAGDAGEAFEFGVLATILDRIGA